MRTTPTGSLFPPRGNTPMPTHGLDVEFPMLWAAAKAVDDAEKGGYTAAVMPLHREMEAAMRELWMARQTARGPIE